MNSSSIVARAVASQFQNHAATSKPSSLAKFHSDTSR
jgi:hypothetical protein